MVVLLERSLLLGREAHPGGTSIPSVRITVSVLRVAWHSRFGVASAAACLHAWMRPVLSRFGHAAPSLSPLPIVLDFWRAADAIGADR